MRGYPRELVQTLVPHDLLVEVTEERLGVGVVQFPAFLVFTGHHLAWLHVLPKEEFLCGCDVFTRRRSQVFKTNAAILIGIKPVEEGFDHIHRRFEAPGIDLVMKLVKENEPCLHLVDVCECLLKGFVLAV